MTKKKYFFLLFCINYSIYCKNEHLVTLKEYKKNNESHHQSVINNNVIQNTIYITAKNIITKFHEFIEYEGDAKIQQNKQILTANNIKFFYNNKNSKHLISSIIITGDIKYQNPYLKLNSTHGWYNHHNKNIEFQNSYFQINNHNVHGYAKNIKLQNNNRYSILEDGIINLCISNKNTWNITGSKIIFDHNQKIIKIKNAIFTFINAPIIYIPYLQIPIGDIRQSGFLLPKLQYVNKYGINLSIPYYLNIANNYDMTITPEFTSLHMTKINNEFRYLTPLGNGKFFFEWYNKNNINNIKEIEKKYNNSNKWYFHWNHQYKYNAKYLNIDYINSNINYYHDQIYPNNNIGIINFTNQYECNYILNNLQIILNHKKIKNFEDDKLEHDINQLDLYYHRYNLNSFNFNTHMQLYNTTHFKENIININRIHLEPEINVLLYDNLFKINNTIKLLNTYYQQTSNNIKNINKIKNNILRIIPIINCDIKMLFKKKIKLKKYYLQTLEPRIQYSYIPYYNHKNIYNNDSTNMRHDYNSLFNYKNYTGIDRIPSMNQLTTGITTTIYDDQLNEYVNFSIGHIYYFHLPKSEEQNLFNKKTENILLWGSDLYLQLTNHCIFKSNIQYDANTNKIAIGNIIMEYNKNSNKWFQIKYRIIDYNYINNIMNTSHLTKQNIIQIGSILHWNINNQWSLGGTYNYDIENNQYTNQLINLCYNGCPWILHVYHERKIIEWNKKNHYKKYDNIWSLNIELKLFK
uniref:LPS-assembly protein LptD n=1 Tax=Candidatus Aschnera chinzeii TaxID=1485666 RepID=A0AAT9G3S2_9ENTR|nr:MAG: LPS assembly protein LptD [Candidatus Aschnera chinzeii]